MHYPMTNLLQQDNMFGLKSFRYSNRTSQHKKCSLRGELYRHERMESQDLK